MSDLLLVYAGIQSEVGQLEKRRLSLGKFIKDPMKYLIAIYKLMPLPSCSLETYIFLLHIFLLKTDGKKFHTYLTMQKCQIISR